jgi:hypothetical protein
MYENQNERQAYNINNPEYAKLNFIYYNLSKYYKNYFIIKFNY